ncbi:chalcone isomerase family protein [Oceanobacter kriegii]|uniref:hypothetical protein n=1 Tax=Oceanobacter kriegii TaxID=64972 RepID=UPI00040FD2A4|nr:hypothetical protein [Oceanobacter kriegii]
MKRATLAFWLTCSAFSNAAMAAQPLDNHAHVAFSGQPLTLLSTHSRDIGYLPQAYTGQYFEASDRTHGVRQLNLTIHSDVLSGRAIGMSLLEQIVINEDWETVLELEDRMNSLVKMLDRRLVKGDHIIIEYTEGRGSEIQVQGEFMGILLGQDLFDAIASSTASPLAITTPSISKLSGPERSKQQVSLLAANLKTAKSDITKASL